MYTIKIHFEEPGLEPIILEHIEPGQSILEICLNHDLNLHHNCGGVCTCSTCHIHMHKGGMHLEEKSRREADFLKKALQSDEDSRLACQCLLVDKEGEIEITIPDQRQVSDD